MDPRFFGNPNIAYVGSIKKENQITWEVPANREIKIVPLLSIEEENNKLTIRHCEQKPLQPVFAASYSNNVASLFNQQNRTEEFNTATLRMGIAQSLGGFTCASAQDPALQIGIARSLAGPSSTDEEDMQLQQALAASLLDVPRMGR